MKEEELLNTGTLYWFKSQRRGEVAVPIHYLTDEQKKTLSSGLALRKYELCNPYEYFTSHYMWLDDKRGGYFLVTDIQLSPELKRGISPKKTKIEKFPYRITLTDMNRLINDLKIGEVNEIFVEKFLSDTPWNPWGEKEWKLNRDSIIKKSCKYCASQENLVLQHTKQPRKIGSILYELVGNRFEDFQNYLELNKNSIELAFPENIQKVPTCPKCGSSQVHYRIKGTNKGTFVCNKSKNYVVCKHQFTNPDLGYDESDIKQAEETRKGYLRNEFCKKEGLLRIAAEICLEEIIEYLNLVHIITLCNKCAYKEDKPYEKYYLGGR